VKRSFELAPWHVGAPRSGVDVEMEWKGRAKAEVAQSSEMIVFGIVDCSRRGLVVVGIVH
jgi:hypothetical protein